MWGRPVEGRNPGDESRISPHARRKRKSPPPEDQLLQTPTKAAGRRSREPRPPVHPKRRKAHPSEEQLLAALARSVGRKARERDLDDPDRHFLLSLLPHFRRLPDDVKLEVQGEFINTLKRFRREAAFDSRLSPPTHFLPGLPPQTFPLSNAGPSSTEPQQNLASATHCPRANPQPSKSAGAPVASQPQSTRTLSPSPESPAASEVASPRSDGSSICDDYFPH